MNKDLKKLEQEVEKNTEKIDRNYQMALENTEKINNNLEKITRNSVALDILKDYKKGISKRDIIIGILCLINIVLLAIIIHHHW
jgi:lipid II:glycine glycyltransferase (peptidoglycan interpeptide bridge formation enzyme)